MGRRGNGKTRGYFFLLKRKRKETIRKRNVLVHHRIVSAVKMVVSVSDRCHLYFSVVDGEYHSLNVHAPSEHKCDDSKGSFNRELKQVFDHFRYVLH